MNYKTDMKVKVKKDWLWGLPAHQHCTLDSH